MVEENLTAKEKELVDSYRTLGPEEKVAFRDILNAFNQDFGELKNFINKSGLLDPENKKAR